MSKIKITDKNMDDLIKNNFSSNSVGEIDISGLVMKKISDYEDKKNIKYYHLERIISVAVVILSIFSICIFEYFIPDRRYLLSLLKINFIAARISFDGFFIIISLCMIISFVFNRKFKNLFVRL